MVLDKKPISYMYMYVTYNIWHGLLNIPRYFLDFAFKCQNIIPSMIDHFPEHHKVGIYCGWLNFRGVPISVVFVEGSIQEFQYPRISDFLYKLWRKNTMGTNCKPHEYVNFVQSRKIGTHENKAIHSVSFAWGSRARNVTSEDFKGCNWYDMSSIGLQLLWRVFWYSFWYIWL